MKQSDRQPTYQSERLDEQSSKPSVRAEMRLAALFPGIGLAVIVSIGGTLLARFLGQTVLGFETSPISGIALAVILGMLVRNGALEGERGRRYWERFQPGIRFCTKTVLRIGIVLLGIRLTLAGIAAIGFVSLPIILACVSSALAISLVLTKLFRLPERLGILIAIGTSICGVSAIVALAPGVDAKEEEVSYAVANVALFGLTAMFLYPLLGHVIFGDDAKPIGLLLGTSIHDTAQVAGAGLMYAQSYGSDAVAEIAIFIKLLRNILMIGLVPLMTFFYVKTVKPTERSAAQSRGLLALLPTFILGFLLMVALRTVGDFTLGANGLAYGLWHADGWQMVRGDIQSWAEYLLTAAMAAVGCGTTFRSIRGLGYAPLIVGFATVGMVGVVSVGVLLLLRGFGAV